MTDIFRFSHEPQRRHRFVIYLPTETRKGEAVAGFQTFAAAVEEVICERLGGVTSYPAQGVYLRESGDIQREQVQVLESFCDEETWKDEAEFLSRLAQVLARELDQESIACSLDGQMALSTADETAPRSAIELETVTAQTLKELIHSISAATDGNPKVIPFHPT